MTTNKDLRPTYWQAAGLVFGSPVAVGFYLGMIGGWLIWGILL